MNENSFRNNSRKNSFQIFNFLFVIYLPIFYTAKDQEKGKKEKRISNKHKIELNYFKHYCKYYPVDRK